MTSSTTTRIHSSGSGLTIQRLAPNNWVLLRDTRLAALDESPKAFAAHREDEERWTEADWRDTLSQSSWWAALAGGEVVGLARCIDIGRTRFHNLEAIWVSPSHRGQGVFRVMLANLVAQARRVGVAELQLWVLEENHQAQEVYSSLGFKWTGESGHPPGAPDRVEWRMRLRLTPPLPATHRGAHVHR